MIDNKLKLEKGERIRTDGRYEYRITKRGKHKSVSAKTLPELRQKKEALAYMKYSGKDIYSKSTLNDIYEKWKNTKVGVKGNTFSNYCYMYEEYAYHEIGKKIITEIENDDIVEFYIMLYKKKHLQANTIDCLHTVLIQVFDKAISKNIIRYNPTYKALKGVKAEEKLKKENEENEDDEGEIQFLEVEEEKTLFEFIKNSINYQRWYPLLRFMAITGLRIGEVGALQKSDIDFEKKEIKVKKTIETYTIKDPDTGKSKTVYEISSPKTAAGKRTLSLTKECEDLIIQEINYCQEAGIKCKASIGRYNDFLFLNKEGSFYKGCTVNKALYRIISACNAELMKKKQKDKLIPHVHCHMLRHTYNTRLLESGIQVEDRMAILGQTDPEVNMRIYSHTSNDRIKKVMMIAENARKNENLCYNAIEVESQINQNDFNPTRPTLAQYTG